MALEAFDDIDVGKVYASKVGTKIVGVKILRGFHFEEAGFRWIVQGGFAASEYEEFKPYSTSLQVWQRSDFDKYEGQFTPTVGLRKGDILEALDKEDKRVVFLYESENMVHRLTAGLPYTSNVSWSSMENYKNHFTDFRVVENTLTYTPFSWRLSAPSEK